MIKRSRYSYDRASALAASADEQDKRLIIYIPDSNVDAGGYKSVLLVAIR